MSVHAQCQWEIIEQLLDEQRKRKYSLRVIVDAILYMSKTGVQWRMLPKDFPSWQLVYYYFRKWSYNGLTEHMHDLLLSKVRKKKGRHSSPSLGLVDSQRLTENGQSNSFYDQRKRHRWQ